MLILLIFYSIETKENVKKTLSSSPETSENPLPGIEPSLFFNLVMSHLLPL